MIFLKKSVYSLTSPYLPSEHTTPSLHTKEEILTKISL